MMYLNTKLRLFKLNMLLQFLDVNGAPHSVYSKFPIRDVQREQCVSPGHRYNEALRSPTILPVVQAPWYKF